MFATHRKFELTTGLKGTTIAVFRDAKTIRVLYHKTIVVDAKRVGNSWSITLRNGGWDTISTRIVINRAISQICTATAYIYRQKGVTLIEHNGVVKPFESGMVIKARCQGEV